MKRKCPNCGLETATKFCTNCGTKLIVLPFDTKEAERQAEIARQKEAERQAEIARQKEEERQAEIASQKEAEAKAEAARIKEKLNNKRLYDEASSYLEHAEQTDSKVVAAEFYRKAEKIFESLIGWEDSEDKVIECARKAKACEIVIESEKLVEKKGADNNAVLSETQDQELDEKKEERKMASSKTPVGSSGNTKKVTAILAALLILLIAGGGVIFVTRGGSDKASSDSSYDTEDAEATGTKAEEQTGDLIEVENAPELKWNNGTAVLTHYQLEKTSDEGDCINLYFDYTNTGSEDACMLDVITIDTFQNGYELDEKNILTTDSEDAAFNQIRTDASINAARGFKLNDSSEVLVVMTAYDEDYNPIQEKINITIPQDASAGIIGNKEYFTNTDEIEIKDGVSLGDNENVVKITGYEFNEQNNNLTIYFDYTNLSENEKSMSDSNIYTTVFQNGVEQESSGWSNTVAENHFFSKVQKDMTIHCAYTYSLQDKSDVTVKLSGYFDDDTHEIEQTFSIK